MQVRHFLGYLQALTLVRGQIHECIAVGTRVNEHLHWYLQLHAGNPMGKGGTCYHINEVMSQEIQRWKKTPCHHHAKKIQVAPFKFKIVINITLLASYTKVPMFVNGPLDGHAHLKNKGLVLMNILELV